MAMRANELCVSFSVNILILIEIPRKKLRRHEVISTGTEAAGRISRP
jgi:hypothetical protein